MHSAIFLFAFVSCVYGGWSDHRNHDDWVNVENSEELFNQGHESSGHSGGNAAAAGKANAHGKGHATSINEADHNANRDMTSSHALSANAASGWSPVASGAAQAGGDVNFRHREHTNFERERNTFEEFRRKRQIDLGRNSYRIGGHRSNADASSVGAGSALDGFVDINNLADTHTDPWGASGFAAGSATGAGRHVSLFQAANSNSETFGKR